MTTKPASLRAADPYETIGEFLKRLNDARKMVESCVASVVRKYIEIRDRIVAGYRRAGLTRSACGKAQIHSAGTQPLTSDQELIWNVLAQDILIGKEIAVRIGLHASDEDAIRKRIYRMRQTGWRIETIPGRGYWRPDAVPISSTSG